jgi:hypothetical protein
MRGLAAVAPECGSGDMVYTHQVDHAIFSLSEGPRIRFEYKH